MATSTLEERVRRVEDILERLQDEIHFQKSNSKRGWRWFVGIDANNPDFDEAVRLGREWRYRDRPDDEQAP